MHLIRVAALAASLTADCGLAMAAPLPSYQTPSGPQSALGVAILDGTGQQITSFASSASTAITPYVGPSTGTTSATPGVYTQVLAADPQRTDCALTNSGTGNQSVIESMTQPAANATSPYPPIVPGGNYDCNTPTSKYPGAVWIASTVASDPFAYVGDR